MTNPRKKSQKLGVAREATPTKNEAGGKITGGAKGHAEEMAKIQGGKGYGVVFAPELRGKGAKG